MPPHNDQTGPAPAPSFPETLSSRLARVEEAHRAAVERRETDAEAFSDEDTLYVDLLETTLAEIEDKLTGISF